jgi:hypothetical protein
MAIAKEQLVQYVGELGLPQEQTDAMISTLMANEKAATQFVGQRLRHDDYTKKTQELSGHRQSIEQQAVAQIQEYAKELQAAEQRIASIMGDFEKEKISAATANARLQRVKETYKLSDEDIPAVEGVAKPAGTGADPASRNGGIDIDARLGVFKKELISELRRDMMAMPRITAIQTDIAEEHKELTGKRLTRAEMNDLLQHAEKNQIRLEDAWKDKYKIDDLRLTKRDADLEKTLREKWDAERKAKNSEDALAGVRRTSDSQPSIHSPVIGRKYLDHSDPARPATPAADKSPAQQPPQPSGPRPSGAERAAAKFLERRANGIPLGAPEPATKGG